MTWWRRSGRETVVAALALFALIAVVTLAR
jgi:hypothetical protein